MSINKDDPLLENERKSCPNTEKAAWERPTLRRLGAKQAETHSHLNRTEPSGRHNSS